VRSKPVIRFDYLREKLPWREDRHRYYALIEGKDGTIIEYDKNIREQDNMYKVQAYTHSVNGPTVGHRLEGYFLLI